MLLAWEIAEAGDDTPRDRPAEGQDRPHHGNRRWPRAGRRAQLRGRGARGWSAVTEMLRAATRPHRPARRSLRLAASHRTRVLTR